MSDSPQTSSVSSFLRAEDGATAARVVEKLESLLKEGRQLKISLDVDGTIAQIFPLMLAAYNAQKRMEAEKAGLPWKDYKVEDHSKYDFSGIGSNYEEMMADYYTPIWKNRYRDIPFSGDATQMHELSRHYRVEIVTTRSPDNSGVTGGTVDTLKEWLKMHGIGDYPMTPVPPHVNKVDLGYDIYIDDAPGVARDAAKRGKIAFLIDKPYNRDVQPNENIIRVGDVKEAMRILMDAAKVKAVVRERSRNAT